MTTCTSTSTGIGSMKLFLSKLTVVDDCSCYLIYINFENGKNINNYCIINLMRHSLAYFIYSREGRIGMRGKETLDCYVNEEDARDEFNKLFYDKTGHYYNNYNGITPLPNKYVLQQDCHDFPEFELDISKEIIMLLDLIYPRKIESVDFIISKKNIMRARELLYLISNTVDEESIKKMSLEWHSLIPSFQHRKIAPKVITIDDISAKTDLLDDIEANIRIKKSSDYDIKYKYDKLHADIYTTDCPEHAKIVDWFHNTSMTSRKVINIYSVNRHADIINKPLGQTRLLFHGSRNINCQNIINKGLIIKPYGVQTNGSLFGNGLYFSNAAEKCVQYVRNERGVPGIIFICEVDLGEPLVLNECITHKSMQKIIDEVKPDSIKVNGRYSQIGDDFSALDVINPDNAMEFDEFIIYSESRVRIKYLLIIS